ncbi:MAG: DNA polymerase III subunit gamma/tau, partial [Gemmatimonadetes bacterium]|nr:DNA polymerase III subunit gamma/tau [Gemmatimonadota bacterium]
CKRIWGGLTALDVVEIDAASNRGVDDARDLRERAMYSPSEEGRFKVYILDEAHMLTREAWNALLKILEEPPPRVIFVFATTEPQKIQQSASPILSRCQRFDFRRIGVGDITRRLQEVLAGEDLEAPEEALRTIARRADGGLRDALSLLDQVLALTGGDVSQEGVRRVLGLVEDEKYLELLEILQERRHGEVFSFVETLLEDGYDMVEFHRGLVDILRMLLRFRLGEGEGGRGVREDLRDAFRTRSDAFSPGDLVRMLAQATELEATGSIRRSAHPRLLMEMLLLRLSYMDRTVQLEALLKGLGEEGTPEEGTPEEGTSEEAGPAPGRGRRPKPPTDPSAEPPSGKKEEDLPLPEAWKMVLKGPKNLPKGVLPFLKAARVEFPGEKEVVLFIPPGPGLDRVQEPAVLRRLKDAIGRHCGGPPGLSVKPDGPDEGPPERITEGTVRGSRLRELMDKEPALGEAVEELDLELLD